MRNVNRNAMRDRIIKTYMETDWDDWRDKVAWSVSTLQLMAKAVAVGAMDAETFAKYSSPLLVALTTLEIENSHLARDSDLLKDLGIGGGA